MVAMVEEVLFVCDRTSKYFWPFFLHLIVLIRLPFTKSPYYVIYYNKRMRERRTADESTLDRIVVCIGYLYIVCF